MIVQIPADLQKLVIQGAKERNDRRTAEGNPVRQRDGTDPLDAHIFGDAGTMAVAVAYGLNPQQIWVPELRAPDLLGPDGSTVEVKRVNQAHYRLALHTHRGNKCEDDFYFLVSPPPGVQPVLWCMNIRGWVTGAEFEEKGKFRNLREDDQWTLDTQHLHPDRPGPWG